MVIFHSYVCLPEGIIREFSESFAPSINNSSLLWCTRSNSNESDRRGRISVLQMEVYILLQCEAPKIAKLVYNSNNNGLWYL